MIPFHFLNLIIKLIKFMPSNIGRWQRQYYWESIREVGLQPILRLVETCLKILFI